MSKRHLLGIKELLFGNIVSGRSSNSVFLARGRLNVYMGKREASEISCIKEEFIGAR